MKKLIGPRICLAKIVLSLIWSQFALAQTNIATVVKEDDPTPLGGMFSELQEFSSNDAGSFVFRNVIQGGNVFDAIFLASPNSISTVVASGDELPGIGTLSSFGAEVSLNDQGAVAFESSLAEGGTGLFIISNNQVTEIAISGQTTPIGGEYFIFFDVRPNSLNNSGAFAFQNQVIPPGQPAVETIFLFDGSDVSKVVSDGDRPTPLGGAFKEINLIELNDEGKVLFSSEIEGGSSSSGIFVSHNGVISKIAATDEDAPGGGQFLAIAGSNTESDGSINSLGDVVFPAIVSDPNTGAPTFGLFLAASDGTLSRLAIQNDPAPEGGTFAGFTAPTINALKQIAFIAFINELDGPEGLFFLSDGVFKKIAVEGKPSPLGGTFGEVADPSSLPKINAGGLVAFSANIIGGSAGSGLFLWGGPLIRVSPKSVKFDLVAVGETDTKEVEILSTGSDPLVIQSITATPTPPYGLVNLPNLPLTLQPGEKATFGVTFTPDQSGGAGEGELTIASNAINAPTKVRLLEPGIVSDLEIKVDPQVIRAGEVATIRVKALNPSGNVATEFSGNVRLTLLENESTKGIGRLSQSLALIDKGVSQDIPFTTPEEPFADDKPITLQTVLSGTAVIEAELEGLNLPPKTARLEVKSPLNFKIDKFEIQQGVIDTDKEVTQEFQPGENKTFPALPFIADHNTAVRIFVDYEKPAPIPFSTIEGIRGISADLKITHGNTVKSFENIQSGGKSNTPFILQDVYSETKTTILQNALFTFIDHADVRSRGTYDFEAELKFDPKFLDETDDDKANNEKQRFEEFVDTRSLRILPIKAFFGEPFFRGPIVPPDILDLLYDAYPVRRADTDRLRFGQPYKFKRGLSTAQYLNRIQRILDNSGGKFDIIVAFAKTFDIWDLCAKDRQGCAQRGGRVVITATDFGDIPAHYVGHLFGLRDTYQAPWRPKHGPPNPRRSDAERGGNQVETGNIDLTGERSIIEAPNTFYAFTFHDFMGNPARGGNWVDRVTWDHLYQKRFRLDSQQAPALASSSSSQLIAVSGIIDTTDHVTFNPFVTLEQVPSVAQSEGGDYSLEFEDSGGNMLSSFSFEVEFHIAEVGDVSEVPFSFYLPMPNGTAKVMMKKNGQEIASRTFSANPPEVQLIAPMDGASITGVTTISWSGSDPDGDELEYVILYSLDNQQQLVVDVGIIGTTYEWDSSFFPATESGSITVVANDGINEGRATASNLNVGGPVTLSPPLNLTAAVSGNSVILDWDAPAGGTSAAKQSTVSKKRFIRENSKRKQLPSTKKLHKSFSGVKRLNSAQPEELTNGTPVTRSIAQGEFQEFFITVPQGASSLLFTTSNSSGDADIFVRFGAPPDLFNGVFDFSSENVPPDEEAIVVSQITDPALEAGDWFVTVLGVEQSSYTLTATYTQPEELTNATPVTKIITEDQVQEFFINIPQDATTLTFQTSNSSGDPDLFVRFGSPPDLINDIFDFSSETIGPGEESIIIDQTTNPPIQAGNWYISVLEFELGQQSYTLTATHDGTSSGTQVLSYNIYRSTSSNPVSTGAIVGTVDGSSTSFSDPVPSLGTFFYQVTAVYDQGESGPSNEVSILVTSVDEPEIGMIPKEYALRQNYPNPFNPETRIRYELAKSTHMRIEIFNLLGQKIRTLVDEEKPAGAFSVIWDGRSDSGATMPSGVYIYRLATPEFESSKKLLLLR